MFSSRCIGRHATFVLLLAMSSQVGTAAPFVKVFLHDGSYVEAQAMPEVRGERAFFRLHPSGMLAVLPAERIDFEATAVGAESVPQEATPRTRPASGGTVSGGSAMPTPQVLPAPGLPVLELQHPDDKALEDRYALEFTWLSERQQALEEAAAALRTRESVLTRQLRRSLYQPRLAGALSAKLRKVQEQLERREVELQQVGSEIQMLLHRAAARGVRVRRLPPQGPGS